MLRYLHPVERSAHRISDLQQYENKLNTQGIDFPVKVKDVSKFESLHPTIPGINVFSGNENNKFHPLRMAQGDEEGGKYHYSLIKSFSRLFRSQITSRTNGTTYICKKCFTHFSKEEMLEKHITYCLTNETVAVKMLTRHTKSYFQNYFKQLAIPFVVYADFECFTKPLSYCYPNPDDSYTYSYQKNEPSGFCLYLKGLDGINKIFKPIIYTKQSDSKDIAAIFVSKLAGLTDKIYNDFYRKPIPVRLTKQEEQVAGRCT